MKQPPRSKDETIVTPLFVRRVLMSAAVIVTGTLLIFQQEAHCTGISERGRTMVCF